MSRANLCRKCGHSLAGHAWTYPKNEYPTCRCKTCPCGYPYGRPPRHGTGCPRGAKTRESMELGPGGCICGLEDGGPK